MNTIKPVKGYEKEYAVTKAGDVFRITKSGKTRPCKAFVEKDGYMVINLSKRGIAKRKRLHRIVAETFLENPDKKPQINHIDGNKKNNSVENLEWCDAIQNLEHAYVTGLHIRRAVYMLDEGGKILNSFCSTHEAARFVGVTNASISSACRRKHKSAGFIWRYAL